MEKGKLQFMKIKKMLVSTDRKNFVRTSFRKMCKYSDKGVNESSCVVHLICSPYEEPNVICSVLIVQVPRHLQVLNIGTPFSEFRVRDLKVGEETDWLMFDWMEENSYGYIYRTDNFWEMIADIDDYMIGDVINGDALFAALRAIEQEQEA